VPVPVGGHPGGDHHRLRDHPPVDPGLAVGGVEEHVRERLPGQRPIPERTDFLVEVGAAPADFGLGDAGVRAQGPHQVVDLPRRHAVQVGLHHHREQRLVDPPAPLQQRGEERAGAQLRNAQLQIPGRGGQRAAAVPVALRGARLAALVRGGADRGGQLRLDQRLIQRLGRRPDPVIDVGALEPRAGSSRADWSRAIAWPFSS
jgi:hypothetical protein